MAVAVVVGVSCSHWLPSWSTGVWIGWAAVSWIGCLVVSLTGAPRVLATPWFALTGIALGAGWLRHHAEDLHAHDLAHQTTAWGLDNAGRIVELRGWLVETAERIEARSPNRSSSVRAILAVSAARPSPSEPWQDASGYVRLWARERFESAGDPTAATNSSTLSVLTHWIAGAPVVVRGLLRTIPAPRNPGEFDFAAWERMNGIRLSLSAPSLDAVQIDPNRPWDRVVWFRGAIRARAEAILRHALTPETSPLASALLLGSRSDLDEATRDAFLNSGTLHLLAISGLHFSALAVTLGWLSRLLPIGRRTASLLVVAVMIGYALLVGGRPSVVRACVMASAVGWAVARDRPGRPDTALALAALVTIGLNPWNVFHVGCQLSFLAVAALLWGVPAWRDRHAGPAAGSQSNSTIPHPRETPSEALDRLERQLKRLGSRKAALQDRIATTIGQAIGVSITAWIFTAPLVVDRFNLVTPVGIPLNLPMVPLSGVAVASAGATLSLGAIHPALGDLAGMVCRVSLDLLIWLASLGETLPGGSWHTPAPPTAWTSVVLVLAMIALALEARRIDRDSDRCRNVRRVAWIAASLGGVLWMSWWALPASWTVCGPKALILDVGLGSAVVVVSADGRAMLYDCGSDNDPRVGRRVILPALWSLGVSRLDAVALSHADPAHVNGLDDLVKRMPVGAIWISPTFVEDSPVLNPFETPQTQGERFHADPWLTLAVERGVPIEVVSAGQRRSLGTDVTFHALHPPPDWPNGASNAARDAGSLVLAVEFEPPALTNGEPTASPPRSSPRRLLLTGDLDGAGMVRVVGLNEEAAGAPRDRDSHAFGYDLLIAPRHGVARSNPSWWLDWARPRFVAISQAGGWEPATPWLKLDPKRIAVTGRDGALWFDPHADPELVSLTPFAQTRAKVMVDWEDGRLMIWLMAAGVVVLAVATAVWLVCRWGVRSGAWTLTRPRPDPTTVTEPGWREVERRADDGALLRAEWRTAGESPRGTVVILHGFAEARGSMRPRAQVALERGWSVLLPDNRAMGRSEGRFVSFGGMEADDLRGWLGWLTDQVDSTGPIVVMGRSMGAAIALRAVAALAEQPGRAVPPTTIGASPATREPMPAGLILEAPYEDLSELLMRWLMHAGVPGWLAGLSSRAILIEAHRLTGRWLHTPSPIEMARRVGLPTLVFYGGRDLLVPPDRVERLIAALEQAAPGAVQGVRIAEAGHADLFEVGGFTVVEILGQFLDSVAARFEPIGNSSPTPSPSSKDSLEWKTPPVRFTE